MIQGTNAMVQGTNTMVQGSIQSVTGCSLQKLKAFRCILGYNLLLPLINTANAKYGCVFSQVTPLSEVCRLLASELGANSAGQILLSHKTNTLKPEETPASLGLTTADIISKL